MTRSIPMQHILRIGAAAIVISSLAIQGAWAQAPSSLAGGGIAAFDGKPEQWSKVAHASASLSQTLKEMKAVQKKGKLYLMVRGPGLQGKGIWYIDVDNNDKTGLPSSYWENSSGIDLKISEGKVWQAVNGKWVKAGTAKSVQKDEVLETELDLSALGLTNNTAMKAAFSLEGDQYLPAAGKRMHVVSSPASAIPEPLPLIAVDGNPSEWTALPITAEGQGKVRVLKAFVKDKVLSVLAQATSMEQESNYLFIDADNDPDTGYNGWEYKRTGADYMVENGKLFRVAGAGWSWEEVGPVSWKVSDQADQKGLWSLEMQIDLSGSGFKNVKNAMRVAMVIGEDYAPDVSSEGEYVLVSSPAGKPIQLDGNASDWNEVAIETSGDGDTLELQAAQDDSRVYLLVEGKKVDTRQVFYLDSDGKNNTGYKEAGWVGLGADFKIENNKLYKYDAKKAAWNEQGSVFTEVNDGYTLYYFYQDQLDRKEAKPLKIGYVGKNAFHIPVVGKGPLIVKTTIAKNEKMNGKFIPREIFGTLNNPYMGWVAWGDYKGLLPQPHRLVYANITWRDLEPEKGKLDWAGIEKKFQFTKWAAEGSQVILRFVLDDPGNDPESDIPQWLYDELVQAEGKEGAGKFYDTSDAVIGKGFAPNYNSQTLIKEHKRIITEFGKRYDNDSRIAFIQLGSLGHWGEFHNWPEDVSGKFPNLSVSDQYVNHYIQAFPHKMIGMRKPFPIAAEKHLGLFNDVFGSKGSTEEWINWTINGWNEIGSYVDSDQDQAAVQDASRMPDFWKYAFSGGEFHSGNPLLSLGDDTIMETLRQTRASHTTWLGPSSPAPFQLGKDITEREQANMNLMHNIMGYRFVLEAVSHEKRVRLDQALALTMDWNNKGVAPFYFKWPLAITLIDKSGKMVQGSMVQFKDIDIRSWLPGRHEITMNYSLPKKLAPGNYTIAVAILDPSTLQPGVHLGNAGERKDGWIALDNIEVKH